MHPHPVTKETIPITLGHEFSGTVAELGPGVSGFDVGESVVVQPSIFCDNCAACKAGAENVCQSSGFIGLSGTFSSALSSFQKSNSVGITHKNRMLTASENIGGGGGLSDALCVPSTTVLKLPPNVSLDVGALIEPLSVAWHAISAAPLQLDDTVLVLGGGPIGLAIIQCLVAKGVKKIIVSEVAESRRRFAKDFGAQHIFDPRSDDLVKISGELTGGVGPDVVFDCAGVPASINTACKAVKARGTVVNVAIWEKEIPFQPNMLVFKEAKYTAVLGYQRKDWIEVIAHLEDSESNSTIITLDGTRLIMV